jgi:(p)ppGpp synthase/HD superfamily hydrolase
MNRPTDIQIVARAADCAERRHTHQRHNGEVAEPYFNQLAHVAAVLADAR